VAAFDAGTVTELDVDEIARAITRYLADDWLRFETGRRAAELVASRYSGRVMAQTVAAIYQRIARPHVESDVSVDVERVGQLV
jgi:glycosyltransferase involved in cell wall biosynthesis